MILLNRVSKLFVMSALAAIGLTLSVSQNDSTLLNKTNEVEDTLGYSLSIYQSRISTNQKYTWDSTNLDFNVKMEISGVTKKAAESSLVGLKGYTLKIKNGNTLTFDYKNDCIEDTAQQKIACTISGFNMIKAYKQTDATMKDLALSAKAQNSWTGSTTELLNGTLKIEVADLLVTDKANTSKSLVSALSTKVFNFQVGTDGTKEVVSVDMTPLYASRDITEVALANAIKKQITLNTEDKTLINMSSITASKSGWGTADSWVDNAPIQYVPTTITDVFGAQKIYFIPVIVVKRESSTPDAIRGRWLTFSNIKNGQGTIKCTNKGMMSTYTGENLFFPKVIYHSTGEKYMTKVEDNSCDGMTFSSSVMKLEFANGLDIGQNAFGNAKKQVINGESASTTLGLEIIFNENTFNQGGNTFKNAIINGSDQRRLWSQITFKGDSIRGQTLAWNNSINQTLNSGNVFDYDIITLVKIDKLNEIRTSVGSTYGAKNNPFGNTTNWIYNGEIKPQFTGYTFDSKYVYPSNGTHVSNYFTRY